MSRSEERQCSVERPPKPPTYVLVGPETPYAWRLSLAVVIAIAVFTALYLASGLLLPIALAILLSALLGPIVRFLHHLGLPTALGAAMVLVALLSAVGVAFTLLAEPAAQWLARAPEAFAELRYRLQDVFAALHKVSEATEEVEKMAGGETPRAVSESGGFDLGSAILGRTWRVLGGAVVMVFLLYFLLASGDLFLRKVVNLMPHFGEKRLAVLVVREIEHNVSRYLFTVAVINTVLGTLVGLVMFALEMPNPVLWGVLAGLFNFVPYLGPMVTLAVLTAVAVLSFDSLGDALLRPAAFMALTTLEGQLITPLILGRRLMLNPVVVFLCLIFWGWLWGIVGALIAVPLTMIIKILCDAIPPLHPVGEFLAR